MAGYLEEEDGNTPVETGTLPWYKPRRFEPAPPPPEDDEEAAQQSQIEVSRQTAEARQADLPGGLNDEEAAQDYQRQVSGTAYAAPPQAPRPPQQYLGIREIRGNVSTTNQWQNPEYTQWAQQNPGLAQKAQQQLAYQAAQLTQGEKQTLAKYQGFESSNDQALAEGRVGAEGHRLMAAQLHKVLNPLLAKQARAGIMQQQIEMGAADQAQARQHAHAATQHALMNPGLYQTDDKGQPKLGPAGTPLMKNHPGTDIPLGVVDMVKGGFHPIAAPKADQSEAKTAALEASAQKARESYHAALLGRYETALQHAHAFADKALASGDVKHNNTANRLSLIKDYMNEHHAGLADTLKSAETALRPKEPVQSTQGAPQQGPPSGQPKNAVPPPSVSLPNLEAMQSRAFNARDGEAVKAISLIKDIYRAHPTLTGLSEEETKAFLQATKIAQKHIAAPPPIPPSKASRREPSDYYGPGSLPTTTW